MMKRTLVFLLVSALTFPLSASAIQGEEGRTLPVVRIGTVIDGPWARWGEMIDIFRDEITTILEGEFDVRFPTEAALDGGWSAADIKDSLNRLLSDPEIDLVLALGQSSSYLAAAGGDPGKPVVAPFIVSAESQDLPFVEGTSGVANLSYIEAFNTLPRDLKTFREIVPFESLAIIVDKFVDEAIPGLRDYVRMQGREYADRVSIIQLETSVDETLFRLPEAVEAVVVTPLPRISEPEFQRLAEGLIQRGLPGYSIQGRKEVEAGLLASMTPPGALESLARNAAVNVHDIVRGTDAGSLPVSFFPGQQFTINMATARAIDLYPSLLVMVDADLLHEERTDIERRLTLTMSVREALVANRDLMVAQKSVAAGVQAVRERLAELLPRIDLATGARVIDEDRARASGGQAPERSWTGTVSGSQIIYSDRVWSDYTTEKHFQEARNEILRSTELDIIRATSVAYLNIMRAAALEKILKENLRLTRANLERAVVRVDVGIAGPEEIFRWESEVANGRQNVLSAETQTMNRMTVLNRLMHRPLHEDFILEEVSGEDPAQVLVNELFFTLIESPKDLLVFRDFMVAQGLVFSPLLSRLDAEIAAQDRRVTEAKRSFWLPDISLNAEVDEILAEDGAGQRSAVPSDLDSTDWSVGVFASIPIFNSGGKTATLSRRREERAGLRAELESATERVKEGIVINVNRTRSSYPSIGLSRDAAEAAGRNLDLVTDSYERGIKSIIDLLDAQNQALVSEQQSANAGYDFLVDLMNLQRAVGQFDFLIDPQKREDLARKYKEFAEKRGVEVREP